MKATYPAIPLAQTLLNVSKTLLGLAVLSATACSSSPDLSSSANSASNSAIELLVLSNRADLISGDDALVEVVLGDGVSADDITMRLGTGDVSSQFGLRENGRYMGVLTGLALGENTLTAQLPDGSGQRITITNHPKGGPIFSGEQVQPWSCTVQNHGLGDPQDSQCNGNTIHTLHYRTTNNSWASYDPENPPNDVADTTTDEGNTVPFIVRKERGTFNRGIYDFAVLFDPDNPDEWTPWNQQDAWNNKFVFSFGQGCAPGYNQQAPEDPLAHTRALSKGFVVGVSSLNVFGRSCNHVTAAESVMMVKERVIESLGEIRYTIGDDCSGGAEAQNTIAENYPGLLDGIRPECTFADGWTPAVHTKNDCHLFNNYFQNQNGAAIFPSTELQRAIIGHNPSACIETQAFGSGPQDWSPDSNCDIDNAFLYNADTNPTGTRCTLQDYNAAYIGKCESDSFAYPLLDYVGIQWGLGALQRGEITTLQFVHLNTNIGSFDIDYKWTSERSAADPIGLSNFYKSGQYTWGVNLAKIPTIDVRPSNDADFHLNIHRDLTRARQFANGGQADPNDNLANQIYWTQNDASGAAFAAAAGALQDKTFDLVDAWLAEIEADNSEDDLYTKTKRAKEALIAAGNGDYVDGCYAATGTRINDDISCAGTYVFQRLPREIAGGPRRADVLKCELKTLSRNDPDYQNFGITFSDAEWADMEATFPDGVCDWNQTGVGYQAPVGNWLTFTAGPGGVPMPPPPNAENL